MWAVPAQVCNQTPPIGGAPSLMTFRCALDAWVLSVYDVRLAVVLLLHFRCCHAFWTFWTTSWCLISSFCNSVQNCRSGH